MKLKLITMILLLVGSAWLSGCEQEGPAEDVGESIDENVEDTGERMEEAGDELEDESEGY